MNRLEMEVQQTKREHEIKKAWAKYHTGWLMMPVQLVLLRAFLYWWINFENNNHCCRVMKMYVGERAGHTTLWKVIQATFPEQFVLVGSTLGLGREVLKDSFAGVSILSRPHTLREVVKGKICILDLGGIELSERHRRKFLNNNAEALISS